MAQVWRMKRASQEHEEECFWRCDLWIIFEKDWIKNIIVFRIRLGQILNYQ